MDGDFDNIRAILYNPLGEIRHINVNSDTDVGALHAGEFGSLSTGDRRHGDTTGDFVFRLLDIAAQPVLPLDTVVNGNLNPGYSAQLYRHAGITGQTLYFDSLASASGAQWNFYSPDNRSLNSAGIGSDFELTLAESGTDILVLAGSSASPVALSFEVGTPNDLTSPIALNRAPVLSIVPDQVTGEAIHLSFAVVASDPDSGNALTFSVDLGSPGGINASSGVFSWIPPFTGFSFVTNVTVRVTDNGSPVLSAAQTFSVKVIARPIMIGVVKTATNATVFWRSAPSERYRLQYMNSIDDPSWTEVSGIDLVATGFITSEVDTTTGADNQRYYRVIYFPAP
jgi:hypothetical protein